MSDRRHLTPVGGLLVLLVLILTTGSAAADTVPPRLYLPLVSRDFEPAWQWYAPITPALTPAPDQIALALDSGGQAHLLWDVSTYGSPRFIYHSFTRINTAQPWSQPAPVAASLGEFTLLDAPLPGPDGALHLLWYNLTEPDHLRRAAAGGLAWVRPADHPERSLADRRDLATEGLGAGRGTGSGLCAAEGIDGVSRPIRGRLRRGVRYGTAQARNWSGGVAS